MPLDLACRNGPRFRIDTNAIRIVINMQPVEFMQKRAKLEH